MDRAQTLSETSIHQLFCAKPPNLRSYLTRDLVRDQLFASRVTYSCSRLFAYSEIGRNG